MAPSASLPCVRVTRQVIALPSDAFSAWTQESRSSCLLAQWDATGSMLCLLLNASEAKQSRVYFCTPAPSDSFVVREVVIGSYFASSSSVAVRQLTWTANSVHVAMVTTRGQLMLLPRLGDVPCVVRLSGALQHSAGGADPATFELVMLPSLQSSASNTNSASLDQLCAPAVHFPPAFDRDSGFVS